MHIFNPPKNNHSSRPEHSQPLDETFDPSLGDDMNDISMISRTDIDVNTTLGDTTMMFDVDMITDTKLSDVDRHLRKRHKEVCTSLCYIVVFAFFISTFVYYQLLKYLQVNKPMILPYSFHKFRSTLKTHINDYGQ
jgi:hypothetical protein